MGDPFESVVGLLDEETGLHRRLLALARDEQQALIRGDADRVAQIIGQQEAIVAETRALARARAELLELIAEREGKDVAQLTLSTLIAIARPEIAERCARQREALAEVLRELADVNRANAILIRDHLAYLQTVVGLVLRAARGSAYGPEPEPEDGVSLAVDRMA